MSSVTNESVSPSLSYFNDDAETFLDSIKVDTDYTDILFQDHLSTATNNGSTTSKLGQFVLTIHRAHYLDTDCILVKAESQGSIDGVLCGTSLTSYVTHLLETIRQEHHEYIKLGNKPLDRKTCIAKENNELLVTISITHGGEETKRSITTQSRGFLSEGAGLLLQRLMIKKSTKEILQFSTVDTDGSVCPVYFQPLPESSQEIAGAVLKVTGIEKRVVASKLSSTWQTLYLPDGHMTFRTQIGSPIIMEIADIPLTLEKDEKEEKPSFGKVQLKWQDDIQLYSAYLDRKEELAADHVSYVRKHPEIKALLADFIQHVLIHKPDDVIHSAAVYFSRFSALPYEERSFKHSKDPDPFPGCKTTDRVKYLAKMKTNS